MRASSSIVHRAENFSMKKKYFFCMVLSFLVFSPTTAALPLSTNSRWIVDEDGQRVKLACVNWVSHLPPLLAEGLNKQPIDIIVHRITSMGFNCVRFTWPLFMATNETVASMSVRQSFENLGLYESIAAIEVNNPTFLNLTIIEAYKAVVNSLGENNVMVILDNHISKPEWCCSNNDGNGFFGEKYFKPRLWLKGLSRMAALFNGTSNVIGMSLRNELRGPHQKVSLWYKYMQKGAETVHAANPNVLTILSGLEFDKDFWFLRNQPVKLSFEGKLVYEIHWYGFSDGSAWADGNSNDVCGRVVNTLKQKSLFLLDKRFPVFMSEFGIDGRGINLNDNRYFNCLLGVAADLDWDWAYWTLVGSHYLREGVLGMEETYGLLNWDWCGIRNETLLHRLSSLQIPFQGPGLSNVEPYKILYHPLTGLCVSKSNSRSSSSSRSGSLNLGSCAAEPIAWNYTPQKTLMMLRGTEYCLQVDEIGQPPKLGTNCDGPGSIWNPISASKMHLSSKLSNGSIVCLDIDYSSNTVITNPCKCLSGDHTCDPASQWFKPITSTRSY